MLSHLLSILIWLPMLSGMLILVLGRLHCSAAVLKSLGLLASVVILGFCIPLYQHFDVSVDTLQLTEYHHWIPLLNSHYSLGVNGISLLFILLTCFTNLIIVLSAWSHNKEKVAEYLAIFLFSTGLLNGIFAAEDALLFYFFWEASMLPIFLGIGVWGGERRSHAAMKFFLYNLLGSLLLLLTFIYLYLRSASFDINTWQTLVLTQRQEDWIFLGLFAAFAVKMPMWPFHTWFADLFAEAPAGGAIALAVLMLKNGAYGFLRFNLPLTPAIHPGLVWVMVVLALIAIVYVGFASIVQKDMKRLIAYSSISHMGIVMLGIFMVMMIMGEHTSASETAHAAAVLSLQGAIFQMLSHAFASGGLFILVALLAARCGSSLISDYQGLAKTMPVLAAFFVLFCMANVGLPGTSGFIGEFFVILAAMHANFWVAFVAALTLIVSPAYMLWLVKRVIFGETSGTDFASAGGLLMRVPQRSEDVSEQAVNLPQTQSLGSGLSWSEWLMMILLAVPVVYFGVYPHFILNLSDAASTNLVNIVMKGCPLC